jgi:hypothetical protein
MMGLVTEEVGSWQTELAPLRKRVFSLTEPSRGVFALACAERLVRHAAPDVAESLQAPLSEAWSVALGGEGNLRAIRDEMDARGDLDDDAVAAVAFAMTAVIGSADDAWWAANRVLDQAFSRVEYPADARLFRPFAEDLASSQVQGEIRWIDQALTRLEGSGPSADVIEELRQ